MNQFVLQKGSSPELKLFPYIIEFACKRNATVHGNSLAGNNDKCIRIFYILEGKFEWIINAEHHMLYPGDLVIIQPGQVFEGLQDSLHTGRLYWLHIEANKKTGGFIFERWSGLSEGEASVITKIFRHSKVPVISRCKEAARIFSELQTELFYQQIGFYTRISQLHDELFILIARRLTIRDNTNRDFPQIFMNFEQTLRKNLAHQWTVEEMAALVGLGTTTFTEKVKNYSGFSPLNYLITIRISEAIKLLKRNSLSVTEIALDTGFYSSQHFSTTFKKLTGFTPRDFRNKNKTND